MFQKKDLLFNFSVCRRLPLNLQLVSNVLWMQTFGFKILTWHMIHFTPIMTNRVCIWFWGWTFQKSVKSHKFIFIKYHCFNNIMHSLSYCYSFTSRVISNPFWVLFWNLIFFSFSFELLEGAKISLVVYFKWLLIISEYPMDKWTISLTRMYDLSPGPP